MQNKLSSREKEGRKEKKNHAHRGLGLKPGTYCMLGKSLQLHATEVVKTSMPFNAFRLARAIAHHHMHPVVEIVPVRFCTI